MKTILALSLCFLMFNGFGQSQETPSIVSYYFVELVPSEETSFSQEDLMKIQQEHMANIRKMAQEKKLLLAGPFKEGGGLFILNASSEEEASQWVEEDPAVKAGRFDYKIKTWYTQKGMLSLEDN